MDSTVSMEPAGENSSVCDAGTTHDGVKRTTSEAIIVDAMEQDPSAGPPSDSCGAVQQTAGESGAPERAAWGNQVEFILTMIGYAVGLGNVWRFPYLCYKNGGGAFLIPYFGTLALVGLPFFFMELAFGQFSSLGPIATWNVNPMFKGLGYSMVIVNTIIGIYYNVIIAWTIHYFFSSMKAKLPWEDCDNWWNTPSCVSPNAPITSHNLTLGIGNDTYGYGYNETAIWSNATMATKTPSEEYFYNRVLQLSDSIDDMGSIVWELALCLLLSWSVVFFVLIKGISSLGKVVYFTSIFPYCVLTIMLIRGVTLEGAGQGILYYIKPNFSRLADARAWSDAATQIFFSLSTCTGGLIAMASYNPFKNNCLRDSIMVPIINCGTSFYAGFAIFSVLGFMAHQKGVTMDEVAASGPGLVFVVFPEGLSTMPIAPLWAILFFIMMMTLGLSSEFSIIECFFSACIDEFPYLRQSKWRSIGFRLIGCTLFYLIGLTMVTKGGFYIFNLFDSFVGGFPLLIVGFFECVVLMYIYGYTNFADDIEMMIGRRPSIYFRVCWCVMSPLILLVIIIFMSVQYDTPTLFSGAYKYPTWAEGIGWIIVIICVALIPAWYVAWYFINGGLRLLKELSQPSDNWGPANPKDRTGKYAVKGQLKSGIENSGYDGNNTTLTSSTTKLQSTGGATSTGCNGTDRRMVSANNCHSPVNAEEYIGSRPPPQYTAFDTVGYNNSEHVIHITSFGSDCITQSKH